MSKKDWSICSAAAILMPAYVMAQPATGEKQPIELYQAPVAEQLVAPTYPISALMEGSDGWVILNFMIDPQVQPYEVRVVDRVGDDAFVAAARQTLEESVFKPVKVGERAVDGSATQTYRFVIETASTGPAAVSPRDIADSFGRSRRDRRAKPPRRWRPWRTPMLTTTTSTLS